MGTAVVVIVTVVVVDGGGGGGCCFHYRHLSMLVGCLVAWLLGWLVRLCLVGLYQSVATICAMVLILMMFTPIGNVPQPQFFPSRNNTTVQ